MGAGRQGVTAAPELGGADGASTVEVLASYTSAAAHTPLPDDVVAKTVLHILDTIAAAVSGRSLPAGRAGQAFVESLGGTVGTGGDAGCTVLAATLRTSAPWAALANGMAAHADETDDSHAPSRTHPGCAVVPAALAMAEARNRSGAELVRAVALGYDLCGRVPRALWPPETIDRGERRVYSTHAFGGLFGAAAAAGSLAGLTSHQCRYLFSYATQQASGIRSFFRERDHVEKGFVFGGMPAMNGTMSAAMVECGWTGVTDVFTGEPNFYSLAETPAPDVLTAGLGQDFEILRTKFKKYPAGSPIQSPMDGLLTLLRDHQLPSEAVAGVTVSIPVERWKTVHARDMADINIDYLLDAALDDGSFTFAAAHDEDRFARWQQDESAHRVKVLADAALHGHSAAVELETTTGLRLRQFVADIPGSVENPMTAEDVIDKARGLMTPVLGPQKTSNVVEQLLNLPQLPDLTPVTTQLST